MKAKSCYHQIISSLGKTKTLKSHFVALKKVKDKTRDIQLKSKLDHALGDILDPRFINNRTPLCLKDSVSDCYVQLIQYCEKKINTHKNINNLIDSW